MEEVYTYDEETGRLEVKQIDENVSYVTKAMLIVQKERLLAQLEKVEAKLAAIPEDAEPTPVEVVQE